MIKFHGQRGAGFIPKKNTQKNPVETSICGSTENHQLENGFIQKKATRVIFLWLVNYPGITGQGGVMGHTDFIAQFTGERRFQTNTGISTSSTPDWRRRNKKTAKIPPKRRKTLAQDTDSYSSILQDCVYRDNTWKSFFQYLKIPIVCVL